LLVSFDREARFELAAKGDEHRDRDTRAENGTKMLIAVQQSYRVR
jgi:hypothetical protein